MDKSTLDALINKGFVNQTGLILDEDKGTLSDNIKDLSDKEFAEQYTTNVGVVVGTYDPTKSDDTATQKPDKPTTNPDNGNSEDKKDEDKKDSVAPDKPTTTPTESNKSKSTKQVDPDKIVVDPVVKTTTKKTTSSKK